MISINVNSMSKNIATTLLYIMYYPGTLAFVHNASSYIGIDSDITTKVSSTDNAESFVLAPLATILVELSFFSRVS